MKGTVKWFNPTKGFGFVEGEDGADYFVHQTAIKDDKNLNEGDNVTFDAVDAERGKQAQNVELAE
jgi:CspA family cold shock protein